SPNEHWIMARTAPASKPNTITNPQPKPSLANLAPPPRKKRPESLTSREQEILELIWAGFKNKEIGQRLKISVKTVEAHRANMMKKMRVSNTAQLLKTAIQDGTIKIR
ncbi:MAG: response regulator transcription factor, partial [Nitrospirota bacterium]|nr:response regulator transcription factor [Nitrospirota bacterium]